MDSLSFAEKTAAQFAYITEISFGVVTTWNVVEAGLERTRRYYPEIHLRLEQVQLITDVAKLALLIVVTLFMHTTYGSPSMAIKLEKARNNWNTTEETIIMIWMLFSCGKYGLLSLGIVDMLTYIDPYFWKLDNRDFQQLIEKNQLPAKTIQWKFSADRIPRQSNCVFQLLFNLETLFFFSSPPLIQLANLVNIIVNSYSLFHICHLKELSLECGINKRLDAPTTFTHPVNDTSIEIIHLCVLGTITIIASPRPREDKCVVCLDEDPVDMQLCTSNHSVHLNCLTPILIKKMLEIPTELKVKGKGPVRLLERSRGNAFHCTLTLPKKHSFSCLLCNESLPFTKLTANIYYKFNHRERWSYNHVINLVEEEAAH